MVELKTEQRNSSTEANAELGGETHSDKISPLPTVSPKTGHFFPFCSPVQPWLLMTSCLQPAPHCCWKSHFLSAAAMTCPLQGSAFPPPCPEPAAALASLCQRRGPLRHSQLPQGQGPSPSLQRVQVPQAGQDGQADSSLPLRSL